MKSGNTANCCIQTKQIVDFQKISKMYENESDDEESDGEFRGVRKWMPIKLPGDFNPNKVPSTGLEFLHYAMYEAKKCQAVATADIDTSKFNKLCTVTQIANTHVEAPKAMQPLQGWQNQKLEEFTEFRNYIQRNLPVLSEGEDPVHLQWLEKMDLEYPKFSEVSRFNAYTQLKMLELIIKKLQRIPAGSTISDKTGVWTHSILSIIKIPMSPDLCSTLRELARQCALIRSRISEDAVPEMYTHLNFFICIIGIYFKQFDLADKHN